MLVPSDPLDNSDIIMEISAGVGGQEAMLFAGELFNMYCNYIAFKGWNSEALDYEETDLGNKKIFSSTCT